MFFHNHFSFGVDGTEANLQAQRPELKYKDKSFNLFLPLRVYFYECIINLGAENYATYEQNINRKYLKRKLKKASIHLQ